MTPGKNFKRKKKLRLVLGGNGLVNCGSKTLEPGCGGFKDHHEEAEGEA